MSDQPLISCRDLSFAYDECPALFQDVNVEFPAHSMSVVQGPSGSGKTTFLRLLNRLETPTRGEILFDGRPLTEFDPPVLRGSVSYIHQTPTVIDATIRRNLLLPFTFHTNLSRVKPDDGVIRQELEEFLLSGLSLDDNAQSLSGGEKQRLCLLRSMLLSPRVMLLDEPLSALDPESREAVVTVMERLNLDHGITLIIVSHIGFQPSRAQPRTLRLQKGRMERLS